MTPVGETTGQPTVELLPPLPPPPPPPPLPPRSIAAQPRREDKALDRVCVREGCPVRGMATFDEHCPSCHFATQPYRDVAPEAGPSPAPAQPWTPGRTNFDQPQPPIPAITTTVVITGLFGLFGLIPATMHTNRARDVGVRTNKYWKAFGWTMGISVAAWVLLFVILAAAASSSLNNSYYGSADVVSTSAVWTPTDAYAHTATADQAYLDQIHASSVSNRYTDDMALNLGETACRDIAIGDPIGAAAGLRNFDGVSDADADVIVTAVVSCGLCQSSN